MTDLVLLTRVFEMIACFRAFVDVVACVALRRLNESTFALTLVPVPCMDCVRVLVTNVGMTLQIVRIDFEIRLDLERIFQ